MKYYFIATNYNNPYHTVNYINSINKLDLPENSLISIIIVDNQSVEPLDSIEEAIEKSRKSGIKSTLIRNSTNSGYFKGLNIGIDSIIEADDFIAIIGNNDLIFDKDFLTGLHKINFKNQDHCIVPDVYLANGKKQNPHALNKPSKRAIKLLELYYKNYYFGRLMVKISGWLKSIKTPIEYKTPIYIHGGIGAIYILTPNFFKQNDRLLAPVFLFGEEVIISHQIHSKGGKILYYPEIKVLHNEHSSVSRLGNKSLHKIGKKSYEIFKEYY